MSQLVLSRNTRLMAGMVILTGFTPVLYLLRTNPPVSLLSPPALFFGLLAILATLVTMRFRSLLQGTMDRQMNTAFAFPLLLLVEPITVILVFWCVALADWALHPRKPLTVFYNMGQLSLATGSAIGVIRLLGVDQPFNADFSLTNIAGVLLGLLTFVLVNEILTQTIVNLAGRRKFSLTGGITRSGVISELLCIAFGMTMLFLWVNHPPFALIGAVPPFLVTFLTIELARREQQVEREHAALVSLQELGLEVGSELEIDRLYKTLARAAMEGIKAGGAILGMVQKPKGPMIVQVACGSVGDRALVNLCPHCAGLMAHPEATSIILDPASPPHPGECSFIKIATTEFILMPLSAADGLPGILAVGRQESRRSFTAYDLQAMETLRGFADVALANSRLLSEVGAMHERLAQSEKMSALGTLVSGVAHELNNPLTTVIGYSEMMLKQEEDGTRRMMLEAVVREGRRSARIVNNLLTFSRKNKSEKVPTNLNVLVRQILQLRTIELSLNEVEIESRLTSNLPRVLADPDQIQQVIMNLMVNAEHAVADLDGNRRIRIQTRRVDDRVVLEVQDNGPGISEDASADIFLPFYTTKEVGRGTGLGLSICYGIITEHNGEIRHEYAPEGGARFVFELPVLSHEPERAASTEDDDNRIAIGGTILVVDDEVTVATMVEAILKEAGWKVSSTVSATEALKMVGTEEYDIILTDVVMPGMNGMEFFETLGFNRPDLLPRVVFITGDTASHQTTEFLEKVRNEYICKPFRGTDLLATVNRVSEKQQQNHRQ